MGIAASVAGTCEAWPMQTCNYLALPSQMPEPWFQDWETLDIQNQVHLGPAITSTKTAEPPSFTTTSLFTGPGTTPAHRRTGVWTCITESTRRTLLISVLITLPILPIPITASNVHEQESGTAHSPCHSIPSIHIHACHLFWIALEHCTLLIRLHRNPTASLCGSH